MWLYEKAAPHLSHCLIFLSSLAAGGGHPGSSHLVISKAGGVGWVGWGVLLVVGGDFAGIAPVGLGCSQQGGWAPGTALAVAGT